MSSNPATLPLSELLELIIDHRGKTPNKMGFDDFFLSGVPVLSAKHVKTDGLVDVQSMRYASAEMYKKWMKVEVQEGDIILTSEAPMGEVFYIQDDKKYVLGQRVFGLRPNPRLINPRYLAAWLASSKGQRQIAARSSGSTVQGIRQSELLKLEVDLPSKEEQEIIANVRFSLTNKLSLNRSINQTLEAMAQAIFKSWFVDFDPVKAKIAAIEQGEDPQQAAMRAISGKTDAELDQMPREHHDQLAATAALFPDEMQESELGEVPMGWKAGTLTEICQLNPESWSAKTLPGAVRYVDLANTKGGEIAGVQKIGGEEIPSRARRILRYGDTIVGTVRPGNRSFALVGEAGLTGSTGFAVLRPKVSHWLEFVYLVATSETNIERLAHLADGGAYPAVRPEMVVQEDVVLPTQLVAQAFNQNVQPLFSQILANRKSAILLAELRDTLLPKILSGDVSVETLTDEVEQ